MASTSSIGSTSSADESTSFLGDTTIGLAQSSKGLMESTIGDSTNAEYTETTSQTFTQSTNMINTDTQSTTIEISTSPKDGSGSPSISDFSTKVGTNTSEPVYETTTVRFVPTSTSTNIEISTTDEIPTTEKLSTASKNTFEDESTRSITSQFFTSGDSNTEETPIFNGMSTAANSMESSSTVEMAETTSIDITTQMLTTDSDLKTYSHDSISSTDTTNKDMTTKSVTESESQSSEFTTSFASVSNLNEVVSTGFSTPFSPVISTLSSDSSTYDLRTSEISESETPSVSSSTMAGNLVTVTESSTNIATKAESTNEFSSIETILTTDRVSSTSAASIEPDTIEVSVTSQPITSWAGSTKDLTETTETSISSKFFRKNFTLQLLFSLKYRQIPNELNLTMYYKYFSLFNSLILG